MTMRLRIIAAFIAALLITVYFVVFQKEDQPEPIIDPSNVEHHFDDPNYYKAITLDNGLKALIVQRPQGEMVEVALNINKGYLDTSHPESAIALPYWLMQEGGDTNNFSQFTTFNAIQVELETQAKTSQWYLSGSTKPELVLNQLGRMLSEAELKTKTFQQPDNWYLHQDNVNVWPAPWSDVINKWIDSDPNIERRMKEVYQNAYVAQNMTLVVASSEELATIEQQLKTAFAGLKAKGKNMSGPDLPVPALTGQSTYSSSNNPWGFNQHLSLQFELNKVNQEPLINAVEILNSRQKQALATVLMDKGLISDLMVTGVNGFPENSLLQVTFDLTKSGEKDIAGIVKSFFAATHKLAKVDINLLLDQQSQFINQNFKNVNAAPTVKDMAKHLQYQSVQQAVQPWLADNNQINDSFHQLLKQVTPDSLFLLRAGAGNSIRPTPISNKTLASWRSVKPEGQYIVNNNFIGERTAKLAFNKPKSTLYQYDPLLMISQPGLEIWAEQDDQFEQSFSHYLVEFAQPLLSQSQLVASNLWVEILNQQDQDMRQQLEASGGYFHWQQKDNQITLEVFASRKSAVAILNNGLSKMKTAIDSQTSVNNAKQRYLASLSADQFNIEAMINRTPNSYVQTKELVRDLALKDINQMVSQFNKSQITVLIHGNESPNFAQPLAKTLANNFTLTDYSASIAKAKALSKRDYVFKQSADQNLAHLYYVPQNDSYRNQALIMMSKKIINHYLPLTDHEFNAKFSIVENDQLGLLLKAQSQNSDPALIQLQLEKVLEAMAKEVEKMPAEQFDLLKAQMVSQLKQPAQTLAQAGQDYWFNIKIENPHFNAKKRIAFAMENISFSTVKRYISNDIVKKDIGRLIVHQVNNLNSYQVNQFHLGNIVRVEQLAQLTQ